MRHFKASAALAATLVCAAGLVISPAYAQEGGGAKDTAPPSAAPAKQHPAASPEKMAEARQRFERGLALFEEKNFEAARVELERAYEIAPTWKLLYNIGLC